MSVTDTEMLDFVQAEYIDLVAFDTPTGQGDADVGWKAVQSGREVGVSYHDDIRAPIRNAMQVLGYKPKPEPDAPDSEDWKALCEHLTKALGDLSFECCAVFDTCRPSRDTYNRTFDVLEQARKVIAEQARAAGPAMLEAARGVASTLKASADAVTRNGEPQ